jgi:flavin-dependent dehydrogenase
MATFDYDAIVVGCGPAGLMALAELQEKGIKVLGIDKKPRLDENVRSASGFFIDGTEFNGEYIKTRPLNGKTRITYTKCGFSLEYSKPMEGIHHSYLVANSGKDLKISCRKPLYHVFNPTTWLSDRYKRAKKLSIPFMTNALALKAKEIDGGVEVTLMVQGKRTSRTCRKLIAADGLQSRIVRLLGLNRTRFYFGKGPTMEYEMVNIKCPLERGDMLFFGTNNIGGQGGVIMVPSYRGEGAYRVETFSTMPGGKAHDIIEFFTKESQCAKWFEKARIVEESGAMVEMFTPIKTPFVGNILIVSDAAAFGECLYQGATACGYMAAQAVEKELKGKGGFKEYNDWWNSAFEWNRDPKRMADYMKRVLFTRFFTSEEIDFLFDLSKQYPIVLEERKGGAYDYTNNLMNYFSRLPGVPADMKEKMKMIKDADMGRLRAVIGRTSAE